jgi:hypothetical protein
VHWNELPNPAFGRTSQVSRHPKEKSRPTDTEINEGLKVRRLQLQECQLPFRALSHLKVMQPVAAFLQFELRSPAEPMPPPIKEPTEPPENPDAPVREPDPEEPAQI